MWTKRLAVRLALAVPVVAMTAVVGAGAGCECGSRTGAVDNGADANANKSHAEDSAAPADSADPADPDQAGAQPRPGAGPTRLSLIPAGATMVAHVDLASLATAPLWIENRAEMERDPATRRALQAMERCELPFDGFTALDIGVDPEHDRLAIVISGRGVGEMKHLECVHRQLPDQFGAGRWRFEDSGADAPTLLRIDPPTANGPSAGARAVSGVLVDEDTLVLASDPWIPDVQALVAAGGALADNKGGAAGGSLTTVIGRTDTTRHIWFAGLLPTDALTALKEEGVAGIEDVAGTLDLGDGLALAISARAKTEEAAGSMLALATAQITNIKPLAAVAGIPAPALDSVRVTSKGPTVQVRAALTMADIRAVRETLKKRAPQGPPPVGAPAPNPAPAPKQPSPPTP